MKKKLKKLTADQLSALKSQFSSLLFSNPFHLVYENQIPNTGVILIDGEAHLTRRNKGLLRLEPGSMVGVHELVHNEPVKYGCQIKENAEVILLQKSDVLNALSDEESLLHQVMKNRQ